MSGITDLSKLLACLEPELLEGEFVFVSVRHDQLSEHMKLAPIGVFVESEGVTLILPTGTAEHVDGPKSAAFRCITMKVHSSLEAVGMTAAMSAALTQEKISANVVAAFFHDHIFVPSADASRAVEALRTLAAKSQRLMHETT